MAHKNAKQYSVQLGARGRLVLPARVRKQLELKEGDSLILTVEDEGRISLVSFREQASRCRGMLRDLALDRSLASELLAERRREASRE